MEKLVIFSFIVILLGTSASAQNTDTIRTGISTVSQSQTFEMDSLGKDEFSPLDIGVNRGLFILTKDGKLQMRILGSIRFGVLYDFGNFPIKKTFNSYFVPIGDERIPIPNYYADLNQSRFGFEVTRKLIDQSIFIRLEMDFNGGVNGQFRIRHAYGQLDRFLVGQTWSLFSNVTTLPSTVNPDGPTGSVILRTPQIRYFGSNRKNVRWAVALEYARPDLNNQILDTIGFSAVQLIPDLTGRVEWDGIVGAVQLSAVATTISIKDLENNITNKFGFGGSLSGTIDFKTSKILYQLTYGTAMSHFITTFAGTGNDVIYDPLSGNIDAHTSFGGFIAYDYKWFDKFSSNVALGYSELNNKSYQPENVYSNSMSAALNNFWDVREGAKLGLEYMYNHRWNKGAENGGASRVSALFYYDF